MDSFTQGHRELRNSGVIYVLTKEYMSYYTYSSRRVWTTGHESLSLGSEYILNKILKLQARLHVSCFNKFGFDFPLKPEEEKEKG